MYRPHELAGFALSEFGRGLEQLTNDEATARLPKAGGTEMNAVSWTVAHIAGHWLGRPKHLDRYASGSNDATPPTLDQALALLAEARAFTERWLPDAGDDLLTTKPDELGGESIGTGLLRATLHTWFHTGEINAIRQMLGHSEIGFVGDIRGRLEWHGSQDASLGSVLPADLGRFAIAEFERGLDGLSHDDTAVRLKKLGGTQMNAISWTVGHIATHWHWAGFLLANETLPEWARAFFGSNADPGPPPFSDMRALLQDAAAKASRWLPQVGDEVLSSKRDIGPQSDEALGTQLMRAVLHTWFHTGEVNAVRQLLGHPPIGFVGEMLDSLEYRAEV